MRQPNRTNLLPFVGKGEMLLASRQFSKCCLILKQSQSHVQGSFPYASSVADAIAKSPQSSLFSWVCMFIMSKWRGDVGGLKKEQTMSIRELLTLKIFLLS